MLSFALPPIILWVVPSKLLWLDLTSHMVFLWSRRSPMQPESLCYTVLIAGNNFKIHFFWHLKKRKPIGVYEIVSKDLRITTSVPCIMGKAFFFWSKTHILKVYLTTLGLPVFFAHHETLKAAFILKCKKRQKQTSPSDRKDFAQKMDETDRMHVKCEQPPMEQPCLLFSFRGPKARGCCSQSSHVLFSYRDRLLLWTL